MPSILQAVKMLSGTRALWRQLFRDVKQFNDFRYHKAEMGGSGPDFTDKESGEGLW